LSPHVADVVLHDRAEAGHSAWQTETMIRPMACRWPMVAGARRRAAHPNGVGMGIPRSKRHHPN